MKKLLAFCLVVVGVLLSTPVSAGVNNFYFKEFVGDYYLSKDAEGVSKLKVKESVTAVFPDFNQNKGICRQIPFTNQDGKNITLPSLTRDDISVTRNGEAEPIYSIDKELGYYNVCTGTDEYVMGEQTYVFEYTFEKVVTDFGGWQELYWDTNGNGATQRFDVVKARVHLADPMIWTGESSCYVGAYGEKGEGRCETMRTTDGVEFVAENLSAHENLTFDLELKPGSFVVPVPPKNYFYAWLTGVVAAGCFLAVCVKLGKYLKSRDKAKYYKGIFVAPEYQPSKEYGLPEMAEIYLGKKKDVKVAMLLEMAVNKNIEFEKGEKNKWWIKVENLKNLNSEYVDLLAILNGGTRPVEGDTIEIKRRTASSTLIGLKNSMNNKILADLKQDELVEKQYQIGGSQGYGVANVIAMTILIVVVLFTVGFFALAILQGILGLNSLYGQEMIFYPQFYLVSSLMVVIAVVICVSLGDATAKYAGHTKQGLKMSKYMDGLKLYIKMAESERLKFLQSVETVDTSPAGIVKLYEKLLPYAAVFGLEESWMKEMKQYCELQEIEEPSYLLSGLTAAQIARGLNHAVDYASAASTMSSSGGGSSSGSSGSGGGGFSGGGGGGGGFSGR